MMMIMMVVIKLNLIIFSIEYWWQNDDVDVDGDVNDGDDQDCDQPAGGELVFARSTCTWQQV